MQFPLGPRQRGVGSKTHLARTGSRLYRGGKKNIRLIGERRAWWAISGKKSKNSKRPPIGTHMDVDALPAESRKLVPAGPILKGGKKDLLEERSARHLLSGTPFEFMLRGMRTVGGASAESKSLETPAKASGTPAESLRKVGSMNARNPLRKQRGMMGSMLSCVCMAWLGFCMSLSFCGFCMESLDREVVLHQPQSFAWTSACLVEDSFRFSTTWAALFRPKEIELDRQEYALAVVPSASEQEICAAARRTSTSTTTVGIVSARGRGCSGLSSTTRPQKGTMLIIKSGSCYNPNEGERLVFGAKAAGRWKSFALIAFSLSLLSRVTAIGRAIRSRGAVCACFRRKGGRRDRVDERASGPRRVGRAKKSQKEPKFSETQSAQKVLKKVLCMGFVISAAILLFLRNSATPSLFCEGSSFAAAPYGKLSPGWGGRCDDGCRGLPGFRRSSPGGYHRLPFLCPNTYGGGRSGACSACRSPSGAVADLVVHSTDRGVTSCSGKRPFQSRNPWSQKG